MNNSIKCRKCKTEFDSSFGICPKCGTICAKKEKTIIIGKASRESETKKNHKINEKLMLITSACSVVVGLLLIVFFLFNVFSVISVLPKQSAVIGTEIKDLPYTRVLERYYVSPPVNTNCVSEYDEQAKTIVICKGSFDEKSYEGFIGKEYNSDNYIPIDAEAKYVFSDEYEAETVIGHEFVYGTDETPTQYISVMVSKGSFDCKNSLKGLYEKKYDEAELKSRLEELELTATVRVLVEYTERYEKDNVLRFEYSSPNNGEDAEIAVYVSGGKFPIEEYEKYVGREFTNELKAELQEKINITVSDETSSKEKVISAVRYVYETNKLEIIIGPSETKDSEEKR